MAYSGLNFSGWRSGMQSAADMQKEAAVLKAKTKVAREQGLINGIATTGGAIIGGMFGGPMGASAGAKAGSQIGGLLYGNGDTGSDLASASESLSAARKATESRSATTNNDLMQFASANNMLDASGNIDPKFTEFAKMIAAAGLA